MPPSPPRPLSGLRVLDLTRVLAGPYCGMILADLGADVIKVERPGRGDDTRGFAPPYVRDRAGKDTGESAYYLAANRGKRSLSLDLARPEGQALARQLALKADVLIENFKVGDTTKFAMAYDDLKDLNPRLIYCSVTGFGQTGPYARRAGYDAMIQAMGGIMSVTGLPDGQAGAGPMRVGVPIADLSSGLFATIGILAALQHRHASGRGQHVDIGLLDVQVAMLANQAMNYLATGKAPGRIGNAHPNIVPYQMFATADGFVVVAVGNDQQYERFCAVLGRPELAADPRFARSTARVAGRAQLVPLLEAEMRKRTSAEWYEALDAAGIPCGPINTIEQAFADPQVKARGMRIEMGHPLAGTVPLVASPLKLSETPVAYDRPPPLLGEHTDEILGELGLGADAIGRLRRERVV